MGKHVLFFLGGKAASDREPWAPDMKAVRMTIKFAMALQTAAPDQLKKRGRLSARGGIVRLFVCT